ncbi:uncharacterized protein LOC111057087 [Nilaparvata lugens]|uniref:uncharacterized protein LOC111057087 n=1 Tax=Nilaparvata lugens TaxID=108931 RepID=UPI00193D0FCC|nr:uncharacterized protein LOC111057087 [Nilaparvata lugens]
MDKQQSDKAVAAPTSEEATAAVTPSNNTLVESIAHDKEVEVEMASEEWCVVDSSESSPPPKRVHFSTACDTPKRGGRGRGIYFAEQRRVIAQGRGRQIDVAGVSADSSSRNSGQQAEASSSSSLILLDVTNSSQPRIVNATKIDNEVENIEPQQTSSSQR